MASSLILAGGSIQDYSGNNAVLEFTLPGNLNNVISDYRSPKILEAHISSRNFKTGNNLDITIEFDEVVIVDDSLGSPSINVDIGGVGRSALYLSGNRTTALIFRYTVTAADNDSNGIELADIITGGSIADRAGNNANLRFRRPPNLDKILVDSELPSVFRASTVGGRYNLGRNIDVVLEFNEELFLDRSLGDPYITMNLDGSTKKAWYYSRTGGNAITFRYPIESNDNDIDGIGIANHIVLNGSSVTDKAGNLIELSFTPPENTASVIVDTNQPTINSASVVNGRFKEGGNIDISITFSEEVTVSSPGSNVPLIALTIGDRVRYAKGQVGSGIIHNFNYQVVSSDVSDDNIILNPVILLDSSSIRDMAGNNATLQIPHPSNLSGVMVDTLKAQVSNTDISSGHFKNGQKINIIVTFNEEIEVIDTGTPRISLEINGSPKYAIYKRKILPNQLEFEYDINDSDTKGINMLSLIDKNGAEIRDIAQNSADLYFSVPDNLNKIVIDNTSPIITSGVSIQSGRYRNSKIIEIQVSYNENVFVDISDVAMLPHIALTIGTNTRAAEYYSGSGSNNLVFRYSVSNDDVGSNNIDLANSITLNGSVIADQAGNLAANDFTLPSNMDDVIVDNLVPTILNSIITSDNYKSGNYLDLKITFSEQVSVDTAKGSPLVAITVGKNTKYALYSTITGGDVLTFRYEIADRDSDYDGIDIASSVISNGGMIQDGAGNDAILEFTPPTNLSDVIVDTDMPIVKSITTPYGNFNSGSNIDITIRFSEIVNVDTSSGTPRIELDIGGMSKYAEYVLGEGGSTLIFRYTVSSGENDSDGISIVGIIEPQGGVIADLAENEASYSLEHSGNTILTLVNAGVDTAAPAIISATIPSGNYQTGDNIDFTITFSENVVVDTASGTPYLVLIIDDKTRHALFQSSSPSGSYIFRYEVIAEDMDTDGISIASPVVLSGGSIQDSASNNALLKFVSPVNLKYVRVNGTTDITSPSITSVTAVDGNYARNQAIDFTILFSETVFVNFGTEFGTPQIPLIIGDKRKYATYQSGRGTSELIFRYIVDGSDIDPDGISITGSINPNGANIKDEFGNDSVLDFSTPDTSGILIDGTIPKVIRVLAMNGNYIRGEIIDFKIEFSEPVLADSNAYLLLDVAGEVKSANYTLGSGKNQLIFSYTVDTDKVDQDGILITGFKGVIKDAFSNTIPLDTPISISNNRLYINRVSITLLENISGGANGCALRATSEVVCWQGNLPSSTIMLSSGDDPQPLTGVVQISTAHDYACALKEDGMVACWGTRTRLDYPVNIVTQNGNVLNDIVQVKVSRSHACVLNNAGNVYCWGNGDYGQLGNDYKKSSSHPVPVRGLDSKNTYLDRIVQLTLGGEHSCALRDDGAVLCWGNATSGQLGHGISFYNVDSSLEQGNPGGVPYPVQVISVENKNGHLDNIYQISAGLSHTCALSNNGEVFCWGNRIHGQLGSGLDLPLSPSVQPYRFSSRPIQVISSSNGDSFLSEVIQISSGGRRNCVLTRGRRVKCWGQFSSNPVDIFEDSTELGTLNNVAQISNGDNYDACVILLDSSVKCWELGRYPKSIRYIHTSLHSSINGKLNIGTFQRKNICSRGMCRLEGVSMKKGNLPSGARSNSLEIVVTGLEAGDVLTLYDDEKCTNPVGRLDMDGSIVVDSLNSNQQYIFYYNSWNGCSINFFSYYTAPLDVFKCSSNFT